MTRLQQTWLATLKKSVKQAEDRLESSAKTLAQVKVWHTQAKEHLIERKKAVSDFQREIEEKDAKKP